MGYFESYWWAKGLIGYNQVVISISVIDIPFGPFMVESVQKQKPCEAFGENAEGAGDSS